MAALICDGLGNLCRGCGQLCVLPCRLTSAICKPFCDVTGQIFRGPFCIHGVVSLVLNAPPIIVGTMGLLQIDGDCRDATDGRPVMWLLANICSSALHILAPWYINVRIQNQDDPQLQGKTTTLQRIQHLLCYDPIVALYILVVVGSFIWLSVGVTWVANGEMSNEVCDEYIKYAANTSIGCGFAFYFFGMFAFCCSLCVAGIDGGSYPDKTVYHVNDSAAQPTRPQTETNSSASAAYPSKYQTDVENIPVATPVSDPYAGASAPPQESSLGAKTDASKIGKKIEGAVSNGISAAKKIFGKRSGK